MGGLVIKRAFLLAKGEPEFQSVADRVQAVFFLATPHRGSDLANVFSKVLNLDGGARQFVTDLQRNSLATQSINDEFPHHCQDIRLFSFYETLPTNYAVGKTLIVGRDLATMGYANERRDYINANHRGICKYTSQEDPNYRTVRNALATVTDSLRDEVASMKRNITNDQRRLLYSYLGVRDAPEDDFSEADSVRMSGSCHWLHGKKLFQEWLHGSEPQIFSITAKPATGKTVLSGKIIKFLRKSDKPCSFFFFHHGNQEKSRIESFLLSIAWQMALINPRILHCLLGLYHRDGDLNRADHRSIWRKLFLEIILKEPFAETQFWIVDALDECTDELEIVPLLLKAAEVPSLRIFVTSRNPFEPHRRLGQNRAEVFSERILEEDSKSDIALYLRANMDKLPMVDENGQQHIFDQILEKSSGCFLWANLVFQELRNVNTANDVRKILDEVPSNMNDLYYRILKSMSNAFHGKALAKAILTWTVCSTRPLKALELYHALQLDLKDSIDTVEGAIRSCCGQLVYVDAQSQVQMIHLTARDFLLQPDLDSEFAINEQEGHRRLLIVGLQYLNGDEMKAPRRRKASVSLKDDDIELKRSLFANYACVSLSEHVSQTSWVNTGILTALINFFSSSNVLSWIEFIAKYSDLNRLIQTGKALDKFLQGSSTPKLPAVKGLITLSSWATDLVRLVMKFGKNLTTYPSSIFHLIPPFCPPATAPLRQFGSSIRDIKVLGLRAVTWDDCLSMIVNRREQYSSLASSKWYFAIGAYSGTVTLYKQTSCLEIGQVNQGEPVRLLTFGDRANILASAGSRHLRVWDFVSKVQLWHFDAPQQCMSIMLTSEDQILLSAMKDHCLKTWDLSSGKLDEDVNWTRGLKGSAMQLYRRPQVAAFSLDTNLLAIIYKGQDLLLWDLESDSLYDTYSREVGACNDGKPYGSSGVRCLVFGAAANANLLASAYTDGELVVFDTFTGDIRSRVVAFAHILACSTDGSTLAAADPSGSIQLYQFNTMSLMYRINSVEPGIQGLVFSGDGLRLLDIRGSRCRVWEPSVLVGKNIDEQSASTGSMHTTPMEVSLPPYEEEVSITSMACHPGGAVFFCGKEDGSVYVHQTATGLQSHKLFSHAHGVDIVSINFENESQTLSSIDSSSRIMIHKLASHHDSFVTTELLFDHRAATAVSQVLCDKGSRHALVCSTESDTLWVLSPDDTQVIADISYQERQPYRWVSHPSEPEYLILILKNEAHIYSWLSLQRLTGSAGILLEGSILPELSIRSIIPCFNGTILATTFNEPLRSYAKCKLVLWSTSDFQPNSTVAAPVPNYHLLADQVEHIVGTTEITGTEAGHTERLIFLQGDNWICSTDSPSASTEQYVRHFFLPADWLSASMGIVIEVTKTGDVLLVKKDEVAVIKNGLVMDQLSAGGSKPSRTKKLLLAQRTRKSATLTIPPSP